MVGGEGGFTGIENQLKACSAGGKAFAERLKNDPEFKKYISELRSKIFKMRYDNGLHKNFKCDWTDKKHSKETKKQMRISQLGKHIGSKNSQFGTCWIYNKENKKIKKEELDVYLSQGWIKGRKMKF